MLTNNVLTGKRKKSKKIMVIKPSKYEVTEALHVNKKYWTDIFKELDLPSNKSIDIKETQDREKESQHLAEVLPDDLYKKVCATLDLPVSQPYVVQVEKLEEQRSRRIIKEPLVSYRKSIYVDRELDSDTEVELSPRESTAEINVHQELLNKPEREQVTWATHYLQPEREDEKSLVRKADDLTNRIAQEFCEYMKQLGGDQQSQLFTPKAIKELFQIEFDTHVARSLQVIPKELPSVEETIANVTNNPEASHYSVLHREVSKDIEAEHCPDHLQAFNRSLPQREQWRAPKNNTRKLWRSAQHVPKDLVTLKTVWEGITNLRSVKEYCRWMIEHPEHRRAPYLNSLGMFDSAVLEARLTFESQHGHVTSPSVYHSDIKLPDDTDAPIDHIRRRLSQLADSDS